MQVNTNIKKWLSFLNFDHAYTFLFGMLGAMFIEYIAYGIHPHPKEIATVNIKKIVREFSQTEAKKNISDETLKNETKEFGRKIETTLKEFANQYNLVLVPTEAVISGCNDYTAVIIQKMLNKE